MKTRVFRPKNVNPALSSKLKRAFTTCAEVLPGKIRAGGVDAHLSGGDTTFSYTGHWEQDRERFKAAISAKRVEPGPPGVFGMNEIDIILAGYSDGDVSASCTGFAKQSPGLKLEVTLHRMRDD
jgi:hypothetical protein